MEFNPITLMALADTEYASDDARKALAAYAKVQRLALEHLLGEQEEALKASAVQPSQEA